jgi:hypothetical protein
LVSNIGVDQSGVTEKIRELLPGYMAMGKNGMSEHQEHVDAGHMQGPENTLPMMWGDGPFGNLEMGGMFTVLKVRDDLKPGDYRDPGWYRHPKGTVARRVSADPNFGSPPRRPGAGTSGPMSKPPPPHAEGDNSQDHSTMDHSQMDHAKPR